MESEEDCVEFVQKHVRLRNKKKEQLLSEQVKESVEDDLPDESVSRMRPDELVSFTTPVRAPGRILAVIPCFNEERSIGSLVIKTRRFVDEVLVIDDGSNDETARIAEELGATVIRHPKNLGKSAGIKTGFSYMLKHDYDQVVTLDGDGQHNPNEIPEVMSKLSDSVDVSIGLRCGSRTEMPLWRKVGKRVLDYTTSFGSNGVLTDSQSGFRAFSQKAVRKILPKLKGHAFTTESEQLLIAAESGLRIGSSPITCKYHSVGSGNDTSSKSPASHGFGVLAQLIYLIAEKHPLLFIGVPGFVLLLISLFLGIITLQVYNASGVFPISYALITGVVLMLGALGLFMGLLLNTIPNIVRRTLEEKESDEFLKD